MFKNLVIVILVMSLGQNFAQTKSQNEKTILIYSDDKGYMQPFIENTIKNLIDTDTEKLYFASVNSFNRFITDNKYQAELNDLILTQKPSNIKLNPFYSESEKQIKQRIFNILKNYNYFLTVKTNTLGELIEFQFQLFETVATDNSTYNISDKVLSVENFFINPKEKDYTLQITNAIQRLFKKSNKIPDVELKIYNNIYKADGNKNEIILPMNTNIVLDGSSSGDHDSENITYIWRNILNKDQKYQTVNKIAFSDNSPLQEIIINSPGTYKIGFKAFDGIEYSKEVIIIINVKNKPKDVALLNTVTYSKKFMSIVSKSSKQNSFGRLYFDEIQKDSILDKIIITKNPVSQKKINDLEEDLIIKPLSIRKETYFNNPYIEFKSNFSNLNINEEKTYYLYSVDKDGLLYDEKIIKHIYLSRSLINFRLKFNAGVIDFVDDEYQGGYGTAYPSIAAALFVTDNLELELSVPITKRESTIYNGYKFNYPHTYELTLNYLFFPQNMQRIGSIVPLFGVNFKTYRLSSEFIEKQYTQAASFGFNIGADYKLKSWKTLDLDIRLNCNYDIFSSSTFKKVKSSTFGVGTIFKI
jgi:hypothetical protein